MNSTILSGHIGAAAASAFLSGPSLAVSVLDDVIAHRVLPHPLFNFLGQPVYLTNDIFMMLLSALLMLLIFPSMARRMRTNPVPHGWGNFFEAAMDFLRTELFVPMLGRWAPIFTPYLWTAFFFILFANLLGMLPVNQLFALLNIYAGTHIPEFWGGSTGNLSVTAILALCTFFTVHIFGIGEHIMAVRQRREETMGTHEPGHGHGHGHEKHPGHAPQPPRSWPAAIAGGFILYGKHMVPPVPPILRPVVFGLEVLSTLVKPLSLCMRLFAVMMSGPLVVAVFVSLAFSLSSHFLRATIGIPIILFSSAFEALHLLEAFLQAFIFTLLSAAYIGAAVAPEH